VPIAVAQDASGGAPLEPPSGAWPLEPALVLPELLADAPPEAPVDVAPLSYASSAASEHAAAATASASDAASTPPRRTLRGSHAPDVRVLAAGLKT
jgi:hypothetical protein